MFKVALFDLDGTLFDTLPDIHGALEYSLSKNGLLTSSISLQQTRSFIGDGLKAFLQKAVSHFTDLKECPDEVIQDYMSFYRDNCINNTVPYNGIEFLLDSLVALDIKMLVVSNKSEVFVKKIIKYFSFDKYFVESFGGDSFSTKKPSPIPILESIKFLSSLTSSNYNLDDVIMIGDSENDILSGEAAGVKTCLCKYGYGLPMSCVPNYYAENANDIFLKCFKGV